MQGKPNGEITGASKGVYNLWPGRQLVHCAYQPLRLQLVTQGITAELCTSVVHFYISLYTSLERVCVNYNKQHLKV